MQSSFLVSPFNEGEFIMIKQLFFRYDEEEEARAASRQNNKPLFKIIDRRSVNPQPRMFVLGVAALEQMQRSGMMRRMWIAREVD